MSGRFKRWSAVFGVAFAGGCSGWMPSAQAQPTLPVPQNVDHGLFAGVQVYRPSVPVQEFVEWLQTGEALTVDERRGVQALLSAGSMVAVVPWAPFYKRLAAQDGKCTYAGGAFENLARHVQAFDKLSSYLPPLVAGSGEGAALAYAVFAQAATGTFTSALSIGFCPRLTQKPPLCATNALRWQATADGNAIDLQPASALAGPWSALPAVSSDATCSPAAAQAFVERVPQGAWFAAAPPAGAASGTASARDNVLPTEALARLATHQGVLGPPPAQLADLPIVELPVVAGSAVKGSVTGLPVGAGTGASAPVAGAGSRFAVMLSGDGGWAGIDKGLGAALVAQGIPVAGFDSLRYFWSARTPDGLAADLDRVIRYYAARWRRSEVLLIGYSQGADVLPFAINRLPASTRARVKSIVLLGPGQKASFEFHVTNWIGPSGDRPIAPEASKLAATSTLCVYGVDEKDSLCPELAPRHAKPLPLGGGHHFGGDYDALAARLLEALPR